MNLKQKEILNDNNETFNTTTEESIVTKTNNDSETLDKNSSSFNISKSKENEILNMTKREKENSKKEDNEESVLIPTQIPVMPKSTHLFFSIT